jgi:hypothetical protein
VWVPKTRVARPPWATSIRFFDQLVGNPITFFKKNNIKKPPDLEKWDGCLEYCDRQTICIAINQVQDPGCHHRQCQDQKTEAKQRCPQQPFAETGFLKSGFKDELRMRLPFHGNVLTVVIQQYLVMGYDIDGPRKAKWQALIPLECFYLPWSFQAKKALPGNHYLPVRGKDVGVSARKRAAKR